MNGGNGPHSYPQNSEYQRLLIDSAKKMIIELVLDEKHDNENYPRFDGSKAYRIADLGCSIGPNTFFAVQNIIEAVELKHKLEQNNPQTLEFQVFFNDFANNDFNTLFKNIPSSLEYFLAGVPGSFHGRLCPRASLNFVHCSTALHWLSTIPKQVTHRNSLAWNKGRIHYSGTRQQVHEAYLGQFQKDMEAFLYARAQELVSGGLMLLLIPGLPDGVLLSETRIGMGFDVLGSCLEDMAKKGILSQEKVDSFNLPFYYPSPEELRSLIATNGFFNIEKIDKLPSPMRYKPCDLETRTTLIQIGTWHLRAIIGGLIENHFGKEISDNLFERHVKKLVDLGSLLFDDKYHQETNYFVFLRRKVTG